MFSKISKISTVICLIYLIAVIFSYFTNLIVSTFVLVVGIILILFSFSIKIKYNKTLLRVILSLFVGFNFVIITLLYSDMQDENERQYHKTAT